MTTVKYNFEDLYKSSSQYNTRHYGVVKLFRFLYNREWNQFFKPGRHKHLDTTRWCNYILNVEDFINNDNLSIMDKAIIIKIASFREYGNWMQYGDNSIKLERIKDIPIERLEEISLINIKNDKLYLTFEGT